jgi:hypothetical protein
MCRGKSAPLSAWALRSLLAFAALSATVALRADPASPLFLATPAGDHAVELHVQLIVDRIVYLTINNAEIRWQQPAGKPTESVVVNGSTWDTQNHTSLVLPDGEAVFPPGVDLNSVQVKRITGGGSIVCEPSADKVIVAIADMSQRAQPYDFILRFSTSPPPSAPETGSSPGRLEVSAEIDGSDELVITQNGATWNHLSWDPATKVSLNHIDWPLDKMPTLPNKGDTQFLEPDVDLSTVSIIERHGRGLVTARGYRDKVVVTFADPDSGSAPYEIDLSFGEEN